LEISIMNITSNTTITNRIMSKMMKMKIHLQPRGSKDYSLRMIKSSSQILRGNHWIYSILMTVMMLTALGGYTSYTRNVGNCFVNDSRIQVR
jgi:hypothetical protein